MPRHLPSGTVTFLFPMRIPPVDVSETNWPMHPPHACDGQDRALGLSVAGASRIFGHFLADTPAPGIPKSR